VRTAGGPAGSPDAVEGPDAVARRIKALPRRFLSGSVNGLAAEWELRIDGRPFTVSVRDDTCHAQAGSAVAPAAVITTDGATWLAMDEGSLRGIDAFLQRRLHVAGNLDMGVRLQTMFKPHGRRLRDSDMRVADMEVDGIHVAAYVAGRGDPVVLLHGLGGSKISWLPILPALAMNHQVIVPDLPGHGESEKPRGADFSPLYYARVVRKLMDQASFDRAVIVGNSMGGRIALELALRSSRRVRAMALLDPALPGLRWRYVLGFTRVVPTEFGRLSLPLRRRWTEMTVRRLFADPSRLPPDAVRAAAEEFIRIYADPAARLAFFASLRQIVTERPGPFFASMRRVRHPTLVLFGDRDHLVPARLGIALAEHLPNAELHFLHDIGHVPQFEATERTLELLLPFLERVRSA
jgi:pimeloyl-ACP methyl ester carboxylesterase/putative sterol carrier protein